MANSSRWQRRAITVAEKASYLQIRNLLLLHILSFNNSVIRESCIIRQHLVCHELSWIHEGHMCMQNNHTAYVHIQPTNCLLILCQLVTSLSSDLSPFNNALSWCNLTFQATPLCPLTFWVLEGLLRGHLTGQPRGHARHSWLMTYTRRTGRVGRCEN